MITRVFSRHRARALGACVLLSAGFPSPASAINRSYVGGSAGNWSDPTLWSPTGVPLRADALRVNAAAPTTLTIDAATRAEGDHLYADGPLTFNIDGTLAVRSVFLSGNGFPIAVHFNGTTVDVGNVESFTVVGTPSQPASVTIGPDANLRTLFDRTFRYAVVEQFGGSSSGWDSVVVENARYTLYAGDAGGDGITVRGNSVFTQNGGITSSATSANIASSAGDTVVYNLNGGAMSHPLLSIGSGGSATVNQTGGGVYVSDPSARMTLGGYGGTGVYNLSGGTLSARDLFVGASEGTGTFVQTGGAVGASPGNVWIASGSSYTLTAGVLAVGLFGNHGTFTVDTAQSTLYFGVAYGQYAGATLVLHNLLPSSKALYGGWGATFAGLLSVTLRPDYTPSEGDLFPIFQTSVGNGGAFDAYDLPPLPWNLSWEPLYTPTTFSLRVVPEPSPLVASGLVTCLAPTRRGRRR
jgi:hypothetical protein